MRALLRAELAGTPYEEPPLAVLELALEGTTAEARGVVAVSAEDDVVGVAIFGTVAGSVGAGRLHYVTVVASARLRGVSSRLCAAVLDTLAREGCRLVVAEMPDDRALRPGALALTRAGFVDETRVPDFFRDGVALVFWRADLTEGTGT